MRRKVPAETQSQTIASSTPPAGTPTGMRNTSPCNPWGHTHNGRERVAGNEVGRDRKLDGPILVYSIIRFSCVKPTLLNMTEDWTVHGVITKKWHTGGLGGKKELNIKVSKLSNETKQEGSQQQKFVCMKKGESFKRHRPIQALGTTYGRKYR